MDVKNSATEKRLGRWEKPFVAPASATSRPVALALVVAGFALFAVPASAGQQQYEPLSDAVRLALQTAVHDRTAPEPLFQSDAHRQYWLSDMESRLRTRVGNEILRTDLIKTIRYEAQRAGLDPQLVFALIEVESGFRPYAISHAGARGLMQVMPFWTRVIGDGNPSALFNMRTNIRYGCVILRHYLDLENGNLFRALGRYNGSLGKPEYPNLVMGALQRKWQVAQWVDPVSRPLVLGER
jgi:soluble lytic murein transglycosylase-like protein